jgi:WD40 repeat protein
LAIAIGGGGVVRVRHLSAGEESALFDVGHGAAGALRWSPDSSQIASGWAGGFLLGDEEPELALCDQRLMNIRTVQGLSGSAGGQFEWAPSGQLIAMTLGKEIALIENSTATIIRKWASGNQPIRALAWSADGARLATASDEGTWIWDPADGSEVTSCREHATLIAFSPDGRYLAGVNGSEFYLWDATTAATLAIPHISSASRTIDLRWTDDLVLTAADGTMMRWAVPSGDVTPTVTSGVRELTTAERRRFRLPDVSDLA